MTEADLTPLNGAEAETKTPPLKRRGRGFPRLRLSRQSAEARQLAAAILEVLAGERTPLEAAQALGVSPPRYYFLEERALGGLVGACERRPRGRAVTPERELEKLRKEVKRLERECARSQALLRAAQRTVGLSPPERAKPIDGKRKPRRSRLARALKAAEALRPGTPSGGDGKEGTASAEK